MSRRWCLQRCALSCRLCRLLSPCFCLNVHATLFALLPSVAEGDTADKPLSGRIKDRLLQINQINENETAHAFYSRKLVKSSFCIELDFTSCSKCCDVIPYRATSNATGDDTSTIIV